MEDAYQEVKYIEYINTNLLESFLKLPIEIIKKRNNLIYLSACQVVSSIIGMLFFLWRRTIMYILINSLTMLLAFAGLYGALSINPIYLLIHCILTISFAGGFFVIQLISDMITVDTSYGDIKRSSDHILLFVYSLPYIYDLSVGVYNYLWLRSLSKLEERVDNEQILMTFSDGPMEMGNLRENANDSTLCVCCLNNKRETTFNPCGHVVCCMQCSIKIFQKSKLCPLCRKNCTNFIKIYLG